MVGAEPAESVRFQHFRGAAPLPFGDQHYPGVPEADADANGAATRTRCCAQGLELEFLARFVTCRARLCIGFTLAYAVAMHGFSENLAPWIGTNLFALAVMGLAFVRPGPARWTFALLFGGASIANAALVLRDPGAYVTGFAHLAAPAYRGFIQGFFAEHTTPIVLSIALAQATIAGMLAVGGRNLTRGAILAVVFLVSISPLGVGAAFPSNLFLALAVAVSAMQLDERFLGSPVEAR